MGMMLVAEVWETPPDMLKAMSDIMSDLEKYMKRITDFKKQKDVPACTIPQV